jgi:hypothetical protein
MVDEAADVSNHIDVASEALVARLSPHAGVIIRLARQPGRASCPEYGGLAFWLSLG